MKEIKRVKTIEEITGYEACDGKWFANKDECLKYEETARAVIFKEFKQLMIGEPFPECNIWENFGYGGEEFEYAIIEIKNENDLHIANMFSEVYNYGFTFKNDMIGKRLLIALGYDGSYGDCCLCPRTEDELIEIFQRDIKKFFRPEEKKDDNT